MQDAQVLDQDITTLKEKERKAWAEQQQLHELVELQGSQVEEQNPTPMKRNKRKRKLPKHVPHRQYGFTSKPTKTQQKHTKTQQKHTKTHTHTHTHTESTTG